MQRSVLFTLIFGLVSAQPKCADNATLTHIKELESQVANLTAQLDTLNRQPNENATLITLINRTKADIESTNTTIAQLKDQRQDVLEAMARYSLLKDANFTLFSMRNVNQRLKLLQNQTDVLEREIFNLNASSNATRQEFGSLDNRTRTMRAMLDNFTDTIRNSSQGMEQDRTTRETLETKLKALADNIALACARLRNYMATGLPAPCREGNFSGNTTNVTGPTSTSNATTSPIPPSAAGPNVTAGRNATTPAITAPNATRNPRNNGRGRRAVVAPEGPCIDRDNATARENSLMNQVANFTNTIATINSTRHTNQTVLESQFQELNSTLNRLKAEKALAEASLADAKAANQTRSNITAEQLLEYLPLAQELQLKGLSPNMTQNITNNMQRFKDDVDDWHEKWLMLEHNVSVTNATLVDKQNQLSALRQELKMMNDTIRNANGTIATLQRDLETKRKEAADMRQQYNMSQQTVQRLNETISETQAKFEEIQRKTREVVPRIGGAASTGVTGWTLGLCIAALFSLGMA